MTDFSWAADAFFYHLYPLGTCGAPWTNTGGDPVPRIRQLTDWIDPASRIGCNAVLFGPVWESETHGYNTTDYANLDRRLGTNDDFKAVVAAWKHRGFRVVLDAVLNHSGRSFGPFTDLKARGRESRYADWFAGIDFDRPSPCGDPFWYEPWAGHHSLVKYNLKNSQVREYLLKAVGQWIDDFDIDGLRIDAADVMDKDFLRELSVFCKTKKADFWLMGEVVHGDYSHWAPGAGLDSVTNYELFKGLWSSHNDANFFELAWTLNRQFGPAGVYRGIGLATFGDNHDVNRLASTLTDPGHLYTHAVLEATVPGIPTVYYGSEAGLPGTKGKDTDAPLRPALSADDLDRLPQQPLRDLWTRLAGIRKGEQALRTGSYNQAFVTHKQFGFWRCPSSQGRPVLVIVNADTEPFDFSIPAEASANQGLWVDLLNPGEKIQVHGGALKGTVFPRWARILVPA